MKSAVLYFTPTGIQKLHEKENRIERQLRELREVMQNNLSGNEDETAMALATKLAAEAQLSSVRSMIARARTMPKRSLHKAGLGSTVHLMTQDGERAYTMVNTHEADPLANFISPESPLGRLLDGRKVGETVELQVQGCNLSFTVLKID